MDRSGTLVIPARYVETTIFRDGQAWVRTEGGEAHVIDPSGARVEGSPEDGPNLR